MPKSSPSKLAYNKARNARPLVVNQREDANLARQRAIKAGKVKVGDGKEVSHIVALDSGGSQEDSNTFVQTAKKNRGWRKQAGYTVPRDRK